ncbi:alpha/beta fold hydrolase [Actinoplanes sp. NPDC049599]|uniref:alpha/beta fold hydrolase n=1 Tax=Actinoplanes sp. NPDC049599 TaxID=3363903 RepID=UPI0037B99C0C
MVRRVGWTGAVAGWGIVAGWWMPRGPLTINQALWSVGLSVAVGAPAGWLSRSRWSMLVAPAIFVVAVELLRLRVAGPSVDAPRASAFGFVVLVAGRGVHWLLSVLPMTLAAAYGAGYARRGQVAGGRRSLRYARRGATGLLTAFLLLVTVAVAVPARTPAVAGERGIAELSRIDAGGHRLGALIRGADRTAPVLLFVPGAPGGSELGAARRHLAQLERRFVVVTLDRRGGGSSYPALDPTATVTLETAVDDVVAVTEALRRRFHQDKIYLLGHSGGSILGVLAVQRRPELYRAYVGTGQAVDLTAGDRIFYADILAWARATGRDALARTLTAQGPPPYRDVYAYEPIMLYENEVYDYDHTGNAEGAGDPFAGLGASESTLLQKVHTLNAVLDTWSVLYPDMRDVDLRADVPRLEVPVYFVQGAHEMRGLADLFTPWYQALRAPAKQLTVVPTGGHRAFLEQPDLFAGVMDRVLTQTGGAPGR